jgi:hypothetical protein
MPAPAGRVEIVRRDERTGSDPVNVLRSMAGLLLGVALLAGVLLATAPREGGRLTGASPAEEIVWHAGQVVLRGRASTTELFRTSDHVLKVIWAQPPGSEPQLLVLTTEDATSPQPRGSRLYLVDPAGSRPPRRLSPEAGYNFWDVSAGDVDGDGCEEIGLCTYSQTARDPHFARRFFVYSWDETGDLYPRWRGSRLCRPYLSARLADVAGDEKAELLSAEVALTGKQIVVAYEWNQFGFWGLGHSPEYERVLEVAARRESVSGEKAIGALVATPDGGNHRVRLVVEHSRLRPVSREPDRRITHLTKPGG